MRLSQKMKLALLENVRETPDGLQFLSDHLGTLKALHRRKLLASRTSDMKFRQERRKSYCFGRHVTVHTIWVPRVTHYLTEEGERIFKELVAER